MSLAARPEQVRGGVSAETSFAQSDRLAGISLGVAMTALFIGGSMGPLQKLEHIGINWYRPLRAIGLQSYYQGLTIHGVMNVLVWTTFFIVGFSTFAIPRSLNKPLVNPTINRIATYLGIGGLLMAAYPILRDMATVLFTFYPPLKAHPFFYIGLTLVVISTWVHTWSYIQTYRAWRAENPDKRTPLIAFGLLINMVMWHIATLGIAGEMLGLLIPWSLNLVEATDPQLARTLFWFTGHPIVYFWLLPAYVSWYFMIPKQAGGKLFSEDAARLVFWLFLALSIPVGLHHQFVDPGVPAGWKVVHAVITWMLFIPSVLTAFTVCASLETAGRANGGTGLLGWIRALPWSNPSFVAQNLAMILFVFGGIGGLTNASYNLNLVIHNTMWVPGHFHLTVGSATTLSFFGIAYWLIPKLSGNQLFSRKMALWQSWTWFVGMILMSNGLHTIGLNWGTPRRSMLGSAPYASADWQPLMIEAAIGGIILGVSGLLFYTNMLGTVFSKKKLEEPIEMPVAEPLDPDHVSPLWLDRWRPWVTVTIALILLAYGPVLYNLIVNINLSSPGFKLW